MVFRRLAVALDELRDEGLRGRHFGGVIPDRRPGAAQVAFARGPGIGGVEVEADDREGQTELGVLLDQVGHLIAGKVRADDVGLALADLQQIGAEVGDVGCHQFVAKHSAAIGGKEGIRRAAQIVTEQVVGGQRVELLALHHVVAHQRLADGVDHHRARDVDMEGVAVAVLAAQRVRAGADLHEQLLVARRDLHDRRRRRGIDLAHQHGRAILLQHALSLGRGGRRIDRVFRRDVQLAAHDAAGLVDLFFGLLDAELCVGAEGAEKAGQRRQMADLDLVGLAADDRRHTNRGYAGEGRAGFQYTTSVEAGHLFPSQE